MKLEKKEKLKNTIEELGFKEEKDYNGKMVLKNSIPIKKTLAFKEVDNLVTRLKQSKQSSLKRGKSEGGLKSTMAKSGF
ncbi:MAG: hypothetical protein E6Q39_01500 [Crocinitomicaceae bacterium]|nr:MAG: hypothetical protein E6Q39_01500 [Crocinitomicaceae bacterium]